MELLRSSDRRWFVAIAASMLLHAGIFYADLSSYLEALTGLGSPTAPPKGRSTPTLKPLQAHLLHSDSGVAVGPSEKMDQRKRLENIPGSPPAKAAAPKASFRTDAQKEYYPIDQVDQPALPIDNWEIPAEVIASLRLRRLVAQVWIAENGKIRHIEIISSEPLASQAQRQQIEEGLMQTPMTPAIKNKKNVASRRTLEMALEL